MNFVMNELFYRFIISERNFVQKNIKVYTKKEEFYRSKVETNE